MICPVLIPKVQLVPEYTKTTSEFKRATPGLVYHL
jgi:hypothetical protein